MTDTVTRLMRLVEAYRTAGGREEHWARKNILEAELTRLFTPLSDEQIADFLGDEYHNMTESELRYFRLAEKAHGIAAIAKVEGGAA